MGIGQEHLRTALVKGLDAFAEKGKVRFRLVMLREQSKDTPASFLVGAMMTDRRLRLRRGASTIKYWHAGFGVLAGGRVLRRFRQVLVGAQVQISP